MLNKRGGRGFISMEINACICVCVCLYLCAWCVPYLSEQRVSDTVQLDGALVRQVVKDVEGAHRLRASLLVAENKVNPLMQLTWHKLAFQSLWKKCRAIRGERETSITQHMGQQTQHKLYNEHNKTQLTLLFMHMTYKGMTSYTTTQH